MLCPSYPGIQRGNNKRWCVFESPKSKEGVWQEGYDSNGVAGDRGKGMDIY